jgi:phenylalanyl-tRNA synthetase beta chain
MKVPLSWLREFVDVRATAEEIGETMSVRGFAVEGIERVGDPSAAASTEPDAVIDFEVTGNRPDCMSIVGMAREVATAYQLPLLDPGLGTPVSGVGSRESGVGTPESAPGSRHSGSGAGVDIQIDDPDLCGCYVGAVAEVTVAASPAWLQARLKASGIRPISNIVDITNYVLLELGQPMHAFDRTKLGGAQIRVRRARPGEGLKTLDGQQRSLAPDMLVIADASAPVAVAGVMGGADSEVSAATKTIVFESAYFNPLSVRRTSRRLGLKTEASMRFERGIDPGMAKRALLRACALLERIDAGAAGDPIVAGTPGFDGHTVALRRDRIAGFLGVRIPDGDVTRILESLGFTLAPTNEGWSVTVPPRRVDVTREVDLLEEVARHYGFDRIPSTFPPLRSAPPPSDPRIARARRVRHVMTGIGFSEAVTFGFTSEHAARAFAADAESLVRIKNPLSEAFAVLRPSLLPGLIESAATNVRRGRPDVRLFEMGTRFVNGSGAEQAIAFVWTGAARGVHWSDKPRTVDFFDAKSVVQALALAHDGGVEFEKPHVVPAFLTPGKTASLSLRGGSVGAGAADDAARTERPLGYMGELAAGTAEAFGVPAGVSLYVAEIAWDALARVEQRPLAVTPVPRFPAVVRDLSILIDDGIEARTVRLSIMESTGDMLEDVREFDRYQGKGIPEDKVSLSLRLTFRSPDRTLTDAEVQRAMDGVIGTLREKHAAVQR